MTDLNQKLDQIKSKDNFLQKLLRYIPGYDGYKNRDNARELDTQLRNTIANNLDQNKARLKNVISELNNKGKLFESGGLDKTDKKLENVIAKLRSAARGYSGAFDVVKIKEEKLNEIYAFDEGLIDDTEEINKTFAELENNVKANTDFKAAQEKLDSLLDNVIRQFNDRENILRNL
jgi:hypothetical protein